MKNFFKYTLIFAALFFSSCGILDDDGSTLSPLDSKINFKVIESFDSYDAVSTPQIFVELQTEKIYGCSNFGIKASSKIENKSIVIDILGIYKPGVCLTALGPAAGRIKLGHLTGIYEIKFNYRTFSDKYNLLITDSLIILDGKETPNTKPLINFAYRYPKNSFAYYCGTSLENSSICQDFIDTLSSVINISEFHFSQIAEIPYPSFTYGYSYDAPVRFFYYENEAEFDKIQGVMRSFKQNHFSGGGVTMSIISWMNKKFQSWNL